MLSPHQGRSFSLATAQRLHEGLELLAARAFDVVLLDLSLPDSRGLKSFVRTYAAAPHTPIIVLTGHDDEQLAVEAVREGAQDYLVKDQVDSNLLTRSINYAIERKRASEALRESEQHYRTLFNNASDGIFIHDMRGHFLQVNPIACELLGYTPMELLGMGPMDLVVPERSEALSQRLDDLAEQGHIVFETTYAHKTGERLRVEISSRVIEYAGQQAVLSIVRDITERKRMEEVLLRTERLAAMGRMAAALAHEISNPLQAIKSSLELALDFPLSTKRKEKYLRAVQQESDRLMSLTQRVLNFANPHEIEQQPCSIDEIIDHTLALVDKQLQHHKIRVNTQVAETLPQVPASRDQLIQVFLNLILNAVEAMPEGGDLSISAYPGGDNRHVQISFIDTGPGIPPEKLDMIFEPFFTTKEEGTGLGLFISRNILQQHHGQISVSNTPHHGAEFRIELPYR
jgi:PAS domain S-box-containing protein